MLLRHCANQPATSTSTRNSSKRKRMYNMEYSCLLQASYRGRRDLMNVYVCIWNMRAQSNIARIHKVMVPQSLLINSFYNHV